MNKYEIMLILKPDMEDEARAKLLDGFKAILANDNCTVDGVNEWGLRDLAYEIKDLTKGYYVILDTTTTPANVAEFERLSRINANILRHLTIRK